MSVVGCRPEGDSGRGIGPAEISTVSHATPHVCRHASLSGVAVRLKAETLQPRKPVRGYIDSSC